MDILKLRLLNRPATPTSVTAAQIMATSRESLKVSASAFIDSCKEELKCLSAEIWSNPEVDFKEYKAHELLTEFLEKKGFTVDRSYTGIKTAFRATFGSGRPNVCVICEYDALPEIGHACGHNLIAEAGVAAGLGLKAALESSKNDLKGRITVMGTPAEETTGGKINLIQNGAFEDIDIAMMVHPAPQDIISPSILALKSLIVTYTGKAAHAAAFPWEGINALDAAVLAYTSISALRQQMKPSWRVHGVIARGGTTPPVIPEDVCLEYNIRAPSKTELLLLEKKVRTCFDAAAQATGCSVEVTEEGLPSMEVISNEHLAKAYAGNLECLGKSGVVMSQELTISTDMGNVSYVVPSIHPMYRIGSGLEVNHTREFTDISNSVEAHAETLVAAKAMAHTCIDVFTTDGLLKDIQKNFLAQTQS